MSDERYPEHNKLRAVQTQSEAIGEFLDVGLGRLGLDLYETRNEFGDQLRRAVPSHRSIESILAEWFEIDLNVLEAEKRAMLDALRTAQHT